jgi:predicted KAP-like P-loop ATPase
MMSAHTAIEANPRLIKRFLNSIWIQLAIGKAQGVTVDEAVLTKMFLLERCGSKESFDKILQSSVANAKGFPEVLRDIETAIRSQEKPEWIDEFNSRFFKNWASSQPFLAKVDIRPVLFVSREHAPLLHTGEKLSSLGTEFLDALIDQTYPTPSLPLPEAKREQGGWMSPRYGGEARKM